MSVSTPQIIDRLPSTFSRMEQLLDLNLLIKQIALAFGAAMVLGNGYAIIQNKRGKAPKGETGGFRAGRAYWLFAVGLLIAIWGGVSLLT
jgi:hypothetical protein